MTARDLDAWLEKAAAGARDVLADYREVSMRGNCYPVDTETTPEERAYLLARFQALCVIPESLLACKNCGDSGPLEQVGKRKLCKGCAARQRERDNEALAEDRAQRAWEYRMRMGWL